MWTRRQLRINLITTTFHTVRYYFKRKMVKFNSIIVFDAETTGLPHLEYNNTKITELALIGCEIEHLKSSNDLPRVLHKLVFCFNPMKMIQPESTQLSGLENELLMNIKPFTVTDAEVLTHFIKRLPSPVCIIAHNGNKFDFPILQRHLHKLNFRLPDDVYCADSLKAFQDIYSHSKQSFQSREETSKEVPRGDCTPPPKKDVSGSPETNEIEIVYMSQKIKSKVVKNLFPLMTEIGNESQTELQNESQINQSSQAIPTKMKTPMRYKLPNIYEFLHGKCYPNSHRAEDDCKALLSCIAKCDRFLNWIDEKAVSFNSIKPLL